MARRLNYLKTGKNHWTHIHNLNDKIIIHLAVINGTKKENLTENWKKNVSLQNIIVKHNFKKWTFYHKINEKNIRSSIKWNKINRNFTQKYSLIDFNDIFTHLRLLFAKQLQKHVCCTFIYIFFVYLCRKIFWHTVRSNTNILKMF